MQSCKVFFIQTAVIFKLYMLLWINRGRCYWSHEMTFFYAFLFLAFYVILNFLNYFSILTSALMFILPRNCDFIICLVHKRYILCLCSHGVLFSVYVLPLLSGVSYTGGSACTSGDLHCWESPAADQWDACRGGGCSCRSSTGIGTQLAFRHFKPRHMTVLFYRSFKKGFPRF